MFTSEEPSVYGLKHIIEIKLLTLYILDVCLQDCSSPLRGTDWAHNTGLIPPTLLPCLYEAGSTLGSLNISMSKV
jgi:hypothetical protein